MSRYAPSASISYSFGPGPITFAVKWIIIINVVVFVVTSFVRGAFEYFALSSAARDRARLDLAARHLHVPARRRAAHPVQHARRSGCSASSSSGDGARSSSCSTTPSPASAAGLTFLLVSLLPFDATAPASTSRRPSAPRARSSACCSRLRSTIRSARSCCSSSSRPRAVFVMIYGGFALLNTFQPSRGVADAAHLGGLIFGYLYLKGGRGGLTAEIKYRYLKWKMNRLRRKFDVYSGGRSDSADPDGSRIQTRRNQLLRGAASARWRRALPSYL